MVLYIKREGHRGPVALFLLMREGNSLTCNPSRARGTTRHNATSLGMPALPPTSSRTTAHPTPPVLCHGQGTALLLAQHWAPCVQGVHRIPGPADGRLAHDRPPTLPAAKPPWAHCPHLHQQTGSWTLSTATQTAPRHPSPKRQDVCLRGVERGHGPLHGPAIRQRDDPGHGH